MLTYEVALVERAPQPTAVVRAHVVVADLPTFLGQAFGNVLQVLSEQKLAPAGPPFGRFVPSGDGFDVEAGFPATAPVSSVGDVVAAELPGGPTAEVLYRGGYAGVATAYDAATGWIAAHGFVATAAPWESYLDGPEVREPRTLVHIPCRPRG